MSSDYPTPTSRDATDPSAGRISNNVATIIAVIMVLLAMVGTGITLADVTWARKYWLLLVPLYGLLCIFAAWYHARALDQMVIRQILHWIGVGIAIFVDFTFLQGSGEQTSTATGLSSLLILALGCLLAGVHMERLFGFVGLILLGIVVVVSTAQDYLTLVFLIGIIVIAVVFAAQWTMRRWSA